MAMYPSGSIKILQIENEDMNLYLFGQDIDKITRNRKININIPALIKVNANKEPIKLKTIVDNGELVKNNSNIMRPAFFEDGQYELVIEFKEVFKEYTFIQNGINIDKYFKKIGRTVLGSINFKSDVGYSNIDIYRENKKIMTIVIEVFPSKMDYQKDYKEMIYEINEEIASIAFKLLDKTYLKGNLVNKRHQTKTEFINVLDYIFDEFEKTINYIIRNFKHNIKEYKKVVPIHKSKRMSKKTLKHLRTKPELLIKNSKGFIEVGNNRYIPKEVLEVKKKTTIDIYENQFVKYLIKDVIKKIESHEKTLLKTTSQEYYNKIQNKYKLKNKKEILKNYLDKYFKGISSIRPRNTMSLVFKMSLGYKDFYKKYKMLLKGLDLGTDLFKITPKKIYEIYEMWCYLKLHKILFDLGYKVQEYGIIEEKNNTLRLKFDKRSETSLTYEKGDKALKLWYNKTYSVPTINQRPDTILFIKNMSSDQERTYIFDAKYRMKIGIDGNESPLEEDINIMHRYRDAIVSEISNGFSYKYETFGAYVMFPCSDELNFKNNRFYKSIEKTNIGAFPMLPGSTGLITEFLKNILNQSDLEAKEDRVVLDEIDDYYKFKKEDVMVVNTKDKEHLDIYLKNKFYHIPKKQLSSVRLGVEYIAFYQPISKFNEDAGIMYYGKINNIKTYKRSKCLELPIKNKTAGEKEYLRFTLENIKEVNKISPIQLAPRAVSYTTLYLLKNSENMHELKIKNTLEMRVYKILKRVSDKSVHKPYKSKDKYELGDIKIEIIGDRIIKLNGEKVKLENLKHLLLEEIEEKNLLLS